ncbi:MAG: thiopurine S-methyltransferase [Bermanella sp.]|jgi:thiopurine S-methyltransferase, Se/Te detoxification family
MDTNSAHEFWHERWHKNEIGFHLPEVHSWLKRQWASLLEQGKVKRQGRVFVPLCGKTLDIGYFLALGHKVVACELSEKAVQELFTQLALQPKISPWGEGVCYEAQDLCVYVGDIFTLNAQTLGQVDYIYDRAALIALPASIRKAYAAQLVALSPRAQMLLITLDYLQSQMPGPPFAVSETYVAEYYQSGSNLTVLKKKEILEYEPSFKQRGLTRLVETIYWIELNN